jgi:hypothetical protein|tara:strand:+ start:161 stop:775 length:615 start_codon:yes stop_codon:yes gene_type:complete
MKHTKYTITKGANDIETVLRGINGCQIVTMQVLISAGLRKTRDIDGKRTKHEHGAIVKRQKLQAIVGWNYASRLDRAAKREGKQIEFEVQSRMWGERINGTCLVEHKGALYVEAAPLRVMSTEYVSEYGVKIDPESISDLIEHKANQKAKSSTQEELTNEVFVRDYKLDNIETLAANGYSLTVEQRDNVLEGSIHLAELMEEGE